MRTLIAILLMLSGTTGVVSHADILRLRDGRQYMFELARRLNIDVNLIMDLYLTNRSNLPADKDFSLLAASIQPMAKMATAACSAATDLSPFPFTENDLHNLYIQLMFRPASPLEIGEALRDEMGEISFYANCIQLAIAPELLFINDNYLGTQPVPGATNGRY